jgi:hypothetical protein
VEGEDTGFNKSGFIYTVVHLMEEKNSQELEDFFQGRTNDASVLKRNKININMDPERVIDRGVLETPDARLFYLTARGGVQTDQAISEGLQTLIKIQCPDDNKLRFGIWFGPDPQPEAPVSELDLKDTVGDPAGIVEFMDHFRICSGLEEPEN